MISKEVVEDFLAQRTLALVGISRRGKKFGNIVYREMRAKGYKVYPVHRETGDVGGVRCWPNLKSLPEAVGGIILVIPPAETEKVLEEVREAGIRRVWMQQGAESPESVRFCEENGLSVVHGACILMFAEPTGFFHRMHRGIWRLLGKLPRGGNRH